MTRPAFDQQHLRVFVTLARLLSMRQTAAELRLTSSGISHCLSALETNWGCRLFDRSSRRMMLSTAGRDLLPFAEDILERMQRMHDRLQAQGDPREAPLRIGASATASQFILPPALREFRETCRDFSVKIDLCTSAFAMQRLAANELDLALQIEPATHDGFTFDLLGEDDLQFVVHPLHPWALERKVRWDELPHRKLILPERTDETYSLVETYFREENIVIEPLIEIANEESIKQFVRLDLGVGILPRWLVADEISRGLLTALPLGRRRLKRRWGALYAKNRRLSFHEHLFANICGAVLREIIASANS